MACVDSGLLNDEYCECMCANATGAPIVILRTIGDVSDWYGMLDAGGPLDAPVP